MKNNGATIVCWKRWFQVRQNGFTLSQFLSRREAEVFAVSLTNLGAADLHIGEESVSNRTGRLITKMSMVP